MSRTQRFALLGGAVVVLLAVILLTRGGDEKTPASPNATAVATPITTATPDTTVATPAEKKKPKPEPDPGPILTVDKVTTIKTRVGKTVHFRATSVDDEEVHVHGYDKSIEAPAGKVVQMHFKATMPGIFEIEFEKSAVPIGKLEVGE